MRPNNLSTLFLFSISTALRFLHIHFMEITESAFKKTHESCVQLSLEERVGLALVVMAADSKTLGTKMAFQFTFHLSAAIPKRIKPILKSSALSQPRAKSLQFLAKSFATPGALHFAEGAEQDFSGGDGSSGGEFCGNGGMSYRIGVSAALLPPGLPLGLHILGIRRAGWPCWVGCPHPPTSPD